MLPYVTEYIREPEWTKDIEFAVTLTQTLSDELKRKTFNVEDFD